MRGAVLDGLAGGGGPWSRWVVTVQGSPGCLSKSPSKMCAPVRCPGVWDSRAPLGVRGELFAPRLQAARFGNRRS